MEHVYESPAPLDSNFLLFLTGAVTQKPKALPRYMHAFLLFRLSCMYPAYPPLLSAISLEPGGEFVHEGFALSKSPATHHPSPALAARSSAAQE